MRYLALIKPLLLLVGALVGVFMGGRQVYVYLTEKEPAAFTADNFAAQYAGQQWVSVTGRLAVDARAVMPGRGRFANLYVPLVPPDWQRQEPVHVVVGVDGVAAGGADAWAQGAAAQDQVTITGMIRPLGGLNYPYVFPRLKFAAPTITINQNTEPHAPWGMSVFLAICLCLAAWSGFWIFRVLRV
jgi:hypothetical protein